MPMPNERKLKDQSGASEIGDSKRISPFRIVSGIVNSLVPRLGEIGHAEELVASKSTMELIQHTFRDWEIDWSDLSERQLLSIDASMPYILGDLKRLDYPLLCPEMFKCVEAFVVRLAQAIEARGLGTRDRVADTLRD
jgi:hypothetical protein